MTRDPRLDLCRFIAAAMVAVFHVSVACNMDKRTLAVLTLGGVPFEIPNLFSFGASGVCLFFVLSGYCLTLRPSSEGADSIKLFAYLRKRLYRIQPAYTVAVLFSGLLSPLHANLSVGEIAVSTLVHLCYSHGFSTTHFLRLNGALWSMATEVQFYIVFPALYLMGRKYGVKGLLLFALSIELATRMTASFLLNPPAVGELGTGVLLNYQLPGRIVDFCLGIAIAMASAARIPQSFLCLIVTTSIPIIGWCYANNLAIWADVLWPLVYGPALAIIVGGRPWISLDRKLSVALVQAGKMSFSFFLVHDPIINAVAHLLNLRHGTFGDFLMLGAVSIPIAAGFSFILYRYVEERFSLSRS